MVYDRLDRRRRRVLSRKRPLTSVLVPLVETQRTVDHYFDLMSRGGDFAERYTEHVTWTTTGTGEPQP